MGRVTQTRISASGTAPTARNWKCCETVTPTTTALAPTHGRTRNPSARCPPRTRARSLPATWSFRTASDPFWDKEKKKKETHLVINSSVFVRQETLSIMFSFMCLYLLL